MKQEPLPCMDTPDQQPSKPVIPGVDREAKLKKQMAPVIEAMQKQGVVCCGILSSDEGSVILSAWKNMKHMEVVGNLELLKVNVVTTKLK